MPTAANLSAESGVTGLRRLFGQLHDVSSDPYKTARLAAERGQKVAGLMCTYSPEELFHAAGYLPVRILGRASGTSRADEMLPASVCSFARCTLESALAGHLDFLNLMVFSHTCDTMQNLAEIWRVGHREIPVLSVSTPNLVSGGPSLHFFRTELERVRSVLERECGEIGESAFKESIHLYNRHRSMMQRLYDLRRSEPGRLTYRQMMLVIVSSFLMPRDRHLEILSEIVEMVENRKDFPPEDRPRVFVAGSVCQSTEYPGVIEDSGCVVVDDDLCVGSRAFALPDTALEDAMEALARMYLDRPPCPAFHRPGFDPGGHVLEKARRASADGVVFLLTKFCDPWAFDYPHIRTVLEDSGMPTLLVEVEPHLPPSSQFRTRIEAFVELLQARTGK